MRVSVLGSSRAGARWVSVAMIRVSRISELASERLRAVELAEQLFLGRLVFRSRAADPGDIHVVLERDVLVRDVSAPHSAAHARGHGHAVREGPGVRTGLDLPDHHPADRRYQG